MDWLQVLLSVVAVVLTGLLVVIGVQVFLILSDLRRTVKKVEGVVTESERWFSSVAYPLTNLSVLVKAVGNLGEWLRGREREDRAKVLVEGEEAKDGEVPSHVSLLQKRGRKAANRFFRKKGKSLAV